MSRRPQSLPLFALATVLVVVFIQSQQALAKPFGEFDDVIFREKRQLVSGYADRYTSGSILGRKKRQLVWGYADGLTSGTILGRKKRQLVWGAGVYADPYTSGTILG